MALQRFCWKERSKARTPAVEHGRNEEPTLLRI